MGVCVSLPCAVLLFGIALYLRKRRINTTIISIGVDFMQIVSIFTNLNFSWPPQLKTLFQISSASTFNTQVLAPECSIADWSFSVKCVGTVEMKICALLCFAQTVLSK